MPITAVKSIVMTVANLERSIDFYTTVLSFSKIADERQIIGGEVTDQSSLPAAVNLQLGIETIELTESIALKGRPMPSDSRSNDRWFQHIAIVVADYDSAYKLLEKCKCK